MIFKKESKADISFSKMLIKASISFCKYKEMQVSAFQKEENANISFSKRINRKNNLLQEDK